MTRSFIAIESNEKVRNKLTNVLNALERTEADLKIVEPENIHLTLRFLGNVEENRLKPIEEAIRKAATLDPFQIRVEGLGVFPKPDFIRVIWAGVSQGTSETASLRKQLDQELADIGHPSDDKEFTPHYTIARMKSGKAKDKVLNEIEKRDDEKFGTVQVEEIKLKKSKLTPEGPIYTDLETVALG